MLMMKINADLQVSAQDGALLIKTEAPLHQSDALARQIQVIAKTVPGVKEVKIDVIPRGAGAVG
jgi:hypothetical protein